jgi:hypothetical protein
VIFDFFTLVKFRALLLVAEEIVCSDNVFALSGTGRLYPKMAGVYFSIFFRLLKIEKFTEFSFYGLVKITLKGPKWDRTTPSKGSLKILRRTHPKDGLISSICYLPRARKTRKEYSSIWLGDLEKKY